MKRIINLLFWTALILFFIYRHIYHKITHMNSDDLERRFSHQVQKYITYL